MRVCVEKSIEIDVCQRAMRRDALTTLTNLTSLRTRIKRRILSAGSISFVSPTLDEPDAVSCATITASSDRADSKSGRMSNTTVMMERKSIRNHVLR